MKFKLFTLTGSFLITGFLLFSTSTSEIAQAARPSAHYSRTLECANPALGRMIFFLQKEKLRILADEARQLEKVDRISHRLAQEDLRFLSEYRRDYQKRAAGTLPLKSLLSQVIVSPLTRQASSALSPEALNWRRNVLERVQSFPYRNEEHAQNATLNATLDVAQILGRMQLYWDQFTEVHSWQSYFVRECRKASI